ncbi:phosphate/phosphite/phosphonate ABC transporter substrate-binding protein [Desulfomicrobium escambiense]|uniref:phosphate/phosphite/phosphonate ABC transporter substrate-binding protein n=1 Tax=Desulfomicrobium escambiense TaxID=29503 RepID=UPI0003FE5818|nr:phosphate/phosphite/phosphonate ABC transporter substrate-binding protein [Desulfomicrobium escambiense]
MIVRFLLFFLLSCLFACSEDEPVVKVDMSRVESVAPPGTTEAITYAYLPQYSHSVSFERHRRLLEYLRHKTGLSLRQIFPNTFAEHIKMVERGEIDISFTNPFVYISLARLGSEAFARIVEADTGADFQGQVIVRADNPAINRLEDCRGKRLIAVDPNSAGGYLYPMGLFYDHGITRQDFHEVSFATGSGGRQEAVVLAVYAGAYDVGTIRKGTLDVVRDKIDLDQIRVLAESRPYPGWVYSARKGFDPVARDKIAKAMLGLQISNHDHAKILSAAGMIDIIPARDEDFRPIRDLISRLHLNENAQ